MLIVQKFGGSSLADIEKLRRCARLSLEAQRRGDEVISVVSAMGDTTDELVELAQQITPRPPARELDALTTTGEQQSAALMAIMLESLGAKACSLTGWQAGILTDSRYGAGEIKLIAPGRIAEALSRGNIAVVTGYQGFCTEGDITSLGRGGSDTTAVALAAAMEADRCEIYTDVDGIYTADPRVIPQAKKLERIDYRDMLALSESGSQVLHPRSVQLAMANAVRVWLLPSFAGGAGSELCFIRDEQRPPYAGVTRNESASTLTLAGKDADASALSELVILLSGRGIAVKSAEMGDNRVTVVLEAEQLQQAMELVHDSMVL